MTHTDTELGPERTHNPGCTQGFAGTSPGVLLRPCLETLLFSTRHPKGRVTCAESCTQLKAKAPTGWPRGDSGQSGKHGLLSCLPRDQTALYGVKSTIKHCQLRVDSAAPVHYIKPWTIKHASRKVKTEWENTWFGSSPCPYHGTTLHNTAAGLPAPDWRGLKRQGKQTPSTQIPETDEKTPGKGQRARWLALLLEDAQGELTVPVSWQLAGTLSNHQIKNIQKQPAETAGTELLL